MLGVTLAGSLDGSLEGPLCRFPREPGARRARAGACESACAHTVADRFFALIDGPDRLVDAELEEDVPLRIVLPDARRRDERLVVDPRGATGNEELPTHALEVVHQGVERVPRIVLEVPDLRRGRPHPNEHPSSCEPRLHRVNPGRAIGTNGRQERYATLETISPEGCQLRGRAFELFPVHRTRT